MHRDGSLHLWLLGAAFVVYTASLVAVALLDAPPANAGADVAATPFVPAGDGRWIGMNINAYHAPDPSIYLDAIDRIAAMGFNSVQVVTPMFQTDGAASTVELIEGPGRGPSRSDLLAILRHGKARGLRVSLMPQVNFTAPRGNEWRGKISPDRWGQWWESYNAAIDRFLGLGVEAEIDGFVVGCELLSTQKPEHLEHWRALIARCRARFAGRLTYSTNWDSFQRVEFWHHLDAIGISAYWDVTKGAADPADPTPDELATRWATIRNEVLEFAAAEGRPILFTEIGYPSLPWALKDPWNYIADGSGVDAEAQRRGYAAFLEAWGDLLAPAAGLPDDPAVMGAMFYKWDVFAGPPDRDHGYGIAGKPAEQVLRQWLQRRPARRPRRRDRDRLRRGRDQL